RARAWATREDRLAGTRQRQRANLRRRPFAASKTAVFSRFRKVKSMASRKLLLLPGDGIGPEAMAEVRKLIDVMNAEMGAGFETEEGLVGGSAYDAHGKAISEADMAKAMAADAVLFGAVGGPKWDGVSYDARPEAGLLRLRKELELFANLRPAICYPALAASDRKSVV